MQESLCRPRTLSPNFAGEVARVERRRKALTEKRERTTTATTKTMNSDRTSTTLEA